MFREKIELRKSKGKLRTLPRLHAGLVDFCSNDYLGMARSDAFLSLIISEKEKLLTGSTGSRLLTGNSEATEQLERKIADYHHAPCGLIFNSGYHANTGLFSCILQREDTLLYDAHIHASIHDGMRLGRGIYRSFRHNDMEHLETLLSGAEGKVYVVVESVYSMSGDLAPLQHLIDLRDKYPFGLIVDEAHATGVFGEKGEGRVVQLGLENQVMARIHTFGKAIGCQGAIVLCQPDLKQFLINYARPFIYTTALPPMTILAIGHAYDLMAARTDKILCIQRLSEILDTQLNRHGLGNLTAGARAIRSIHVAGNERAKYVMHALRKCGYDVRALLHPTVPKGHELLRICLHSFNTEEEVSGLVECIAKTI